ncbi:MAG: hypothetical protein Q9191_005778 [Dirinaria sp. TL-2023a]
MTESSVHYCSTLDSIWPVVIQNWILCFPCDTSNVSGISETLQTGFEKTLRQRPYLAGDLIREQSGPRAGRQKLIHPNDEDVKIRFSVNDLTNKPEIWQHSYQTLHQQGMPIRQLDPEILVPAGGYDMLQSCPIAAQANFIPGGCLLDVCLNHSFFDGLGGAMAVGAWARNCKELQDQTHVSSSFHPKLAQTKSFESSQARILSVLESIRLPNILQNTPAPAAEEQVRIQENLVSWQLLGLQKPPIDMDLKLNSSSNAVSVSAIFAATSESILRLKADASTVSAQEVDSETQSFVSTFDVTAALIWTCVLRARYADLEDSEKAHSRLRIPVNVRQALGIPDDYPGNVLMNSVTQMPVGTLIAEADRKRTASKIRSSLIFSRDTSRVLDAINLSFFLPDIAARRPLFPDTTKQDLVLTSWQDLDYYKHDWGSIFGPSGNAAFVRLPHGYLKGICALQPRRLDDAAEVLISLKPDQMTRLKNDEEFAKYFKLVSI